MSSQQNQQLFLNTFLRYCLLIGILTFGLIPFLFYAVNRWEHNPHSTFFCCTIINLSVLIYFIVYLHNLHKKDTSIYKTLLCLAAISTLLLCSCFSRLITAPPYLSTEFFFLLTFFIFSHLAFKRLGVIINVIFIAFCLMIGFLWHVLHTPFTAPVAAEIFKSSFDDIRNFLTLSNTLAAIAGVATSVFLACVIRIAMLKSNNGHLLISSIFCLILSLTHFFSDPATFCSLHGQAYNYGLRGALRALAYSNGYVNKYKRTIDSLQPMNQAALHADCLQGNEGCVFLLHLGEGVSANHTSLNGYARNTTPYLRSCKNLINYPDCISSAPATSAAHIAILTNGEGNFDALKLTEFMPTCGSFLEALTHCNFKLFYLATEGEPDLDRSTGLNYAIKKLHPHADFTYATRNQDKQKEYIKKILQDSGNHNICICINNEGSHFSYSNYNKDRAPFRPADDQAYYRRPDRNPKEAEKVVNAYDNTIFETDCFIKDILELLEGKPYIYIYVSDHGENVSNQDGWVREIDMQAFYRLSSCQVPFFFILSDDFLRLHPHFETAISHIAVNSDKTVSHSHLFHTVLGLFGIKSPFYDEKLDLTTDKVQPYTGPHPARNGKSADGKQWY